MNKATVFACLNPYSNGILTDTNGVSAPSKITKVS